MFFDKLNKLNLTASLCSIGVSSSLFYYLYKKRKSNRLTIEIPDVDFKYQVKIDTYNYDSDDDDSDSDDPVILKLKRIKVSNLVFDENVAVFMEKVLQTKFPVSLEKCLEDKETFPLDIERYNKVQNFKNIPLTVKPLDTRGERYSVINGRHRLACNIVEGIQNGVNFEWIFGLIYSWNFTSIIFFDCVSTIIAGHSIISWTDNDAFLFTSHVASKSNIIKWRNAAEVFGLDMFCLKCIIF